MFQGLLKYLGLDSDTQRVRQETEQNLRKADEELEKLQKRLEEASEISVTGRQELRRVLRESDFSGLRRRAARSG